MTSRATSGRPIRRRTFARPRPVRTSTRSPTLARASRSIATPWPCAKKGSAVTNLPRLASTATNWAPGGRPVSRLTAPGRRAGSARRRAPRRVPWVFGSSLASTSGWMPAPCLTPPPPRLRPLGRKYSPTVMSSAPPLESSSISWKTPLPNVRVPTTCRPLAVLERAGHDLRRRGRPLVHQDLDRDLARDRVAGGLEDPPRPVAALGRDDRALGDEDASRRARPRRAGRRRCRAGRARSPWRPA